MSVEALFEGKQTRRLFFIAVVFFLLVAFGVRYYVLPSYDPSLSQGWVPLISEAIENVSATLVVTLFLAAFFWWVAPLRVRQPEVDLVEPRDLVGYFREGLATSNDWRFSGGCGRYFRSAVLNAMKERAREDSTSKDLTAIILNPENDGLCERHARYRAGTRRGHAEGNWTKVRVKRELIATIVIVKATSFRRLLDIGILVSDYSSSFRVDICQSFAIQTREDPTAPALRSKKGSYYYRAQMDEFRLLKEQARVVEGGEPECAEVNSVESLRRALIAMKLTACALSDSELEKVVTIVQSPENPYV